MTCYRNKLIYNWLLNSKSCNLSIVELQLCMLEIFKVILFVFEALSIQLDEIVVAPAKTLTLHLTNSMHDLKKAQQFSLRGMYKANSQVAFVSHTPACT